ncbi:MAG TPA: aminoglycoside phosphotransferase family protein [Ferruginibacter sp.]|nr:aminoglycoside phosphotransferase family protein [Ferruginibacter sp.]
MRQVLQEYGFSETGIGIRSLGSGLINSTWQLESGEKRYVLQKINTKVFRSPEDIAANIRLLANYLREKDPGYLFIAPLHTTGGTELVRYGNDYYRLFPFVEGSHTIDVVEKPEQAFEAAKQFGRFSKLLAQLDPHRLKITLPDFHNLGLRYRQFEDALQNGDAGRISQSWELIAFLQQQKHIVDEFESVKQTFRIRCFHHDTKISNVLFDAQDKGLCVIDLDTVMPGYFISDAGDMMRTYLSPVSEEEQDFSRIRIRPEYYAAIREGYLSEMGDELNATEQSRFHFAGLFMIYMQALRFLTDHLNKDVYYGAKYEGHNFVRAGNQAVLLQRLMEFNPG